MKALDMLQHGRARPQEPVMCLETGETASLPEWAKLISERTGVKTTSVYGQLHRAMRMKRPYLGLNFAHASDVEEVPAEEPMPPPSPRHPGLPARKPTSPQRPQPQPDVVMHRKIR